MRAHEPARFTCRPRANSACTAQADCLELESTTPAEAPDGHAAALADLKAQRAAAVAELAARERDVYMHRGLLEEEEEEMHGVRIDELEAAYAQMEGVRKEQGYALTPWVRGLRCACAGMAQRRAGRACGHTERLVAVTQRARSTHLCATSAQELRIEPQPRPRGAAAEGDDGGHISRYELDQHLRMAEHLAVRGLDDTLSAPENPYLSRLPETYDAEPFPGHASGRDAALRRVECLAAAHAAARDAAAAALAALPEGAGGEEQQALRARLERLGEAPTAMAANEEESWAAQAACAAAAARVRCSGAVLTTCPHCSTGAS